MSLKELFIPSKPGERKYKETKWKNVYNVADIEVIFSFEGKSICAGSLKTAINGPFIPVWLLSVLLPVIIHNLNYLFFSNTKSFIEVTSLTMQQRCKLFE